MSSLSELFNNRHHLPNFCYAANANYRILRPKSGVFEFLQTIHQRIRRLLLNGINRNTVARLFRLKYYLAYNNVNAGVRETISNIGWILICSMSSCEVKKIMKRDPRKIAIHLFENDSRHVNGEPLSQHLSVVSTLLSVSNTLKTQFEAILNESVSCRNSRPHARSKSVQKTIPSVLTRMNEWIIGQVRRKIRSRNTMWDTMWAR